MLTAEEETCHSGTARARPVQAAAAGAAARRALLADELHAEAEGVGGRAGDETATAKAAATCAVAVASVGVSINVVIVAVAHHARKTARAIVDLRVVTAAAVAVATLPRLVRRDAGRHEGDGECSQHQRGVGDGNERKREDRGHDNGGQRRSRGGRGGRARHRRQRSRSLQQSR